MATIIHDKAEELKNCVKNGSITQLILAYEDKTTGLWRVFDAKDQFIGYAGSAKIAFKIYGAFTIKDVLKAMKNALEEKAAKAYVAKSYVQTPMPVTEDFNKKGPMPSMTDSIILVPPTASKLARTGTINR